MKYILFLLVFISFICGATPLTSVGEVIKTTSERQVVEKFTGSITFVEWSGNSTQDIKRYIQALGINYMHTKNYWIILIDDNFSVTTLGGGMIMALDDRTGRIIKLSH